MLDPAETACTVSKRLNFVATGCQPEYSRSHCCGAMTKMHASGLISSIAHVQNLALCTLRGRRLSASQTYISNTTRPLFFFYSFQTAYTLDHL